MWLLVIFLAGSLVGYVFARRQARAGRHATNEDRLDVVEFAPAFDDTEPYDEFALVAENAAEMGVAWPGRHTPQRTLHVGIGSSTERHPLGHCRSRARVPPRRRATPHTWDSVVVALDRPVLAVDLPGHGTSDRRSDRNYGPWENARRRRGDRASRPGRRRRGRHVARRRHHDPPGGNATRSRAARGRDRRHAVGEQAGAGDDARATRHGGVGQAADVRLVRGGLQGHDGRLAQAHGSRHPTRRCATTWCGSATVAGAGGTTSGSSIPTRRTSTAAGPLHVDVERRGGDQRADDARGRR